MIISVNHLTVLLNEISFSGKNAIITYPPVGDLFSVELFYDCVIQPISQEEYETEYRRVTKNILCNTALLKNEVPKYLDLRTCFLVSSVILPENQAELKEIIREGMNRDLLRGKKPLFIGYDTNSLRFRTNKLIEQFIGSKGIDKIGYCLSGNVKNELVYQWDKKYSMNNLNEMRNKLPFTNNFINQPPKDARMARLGAVEYKRISAWPNCTEVSGRERGDVGIIGSFKNYERYNNVDIFLVSGDNNFIEMAHGERLQGLYIKQPRGIPSELTTDWHHLVDLIYVCAVVFGYIEINGIGIKGIWAGKGASDWDVCNLKVEIEGFSDSGLISNVKREMSILAKGGDV